MKVTLEKVYQCEHCGKKTRSASTTSRHEKFCRLNPINKHICFEYCVHLKKQVDTRWSEDGEPLDWVTHMTCTALNKKMYSYLFEKRIGLDKDHPYIKGLERMPLDCNKFLSMTEHEKQDKHR
jgi:hypothetical protein